MHNLHFVEHLYCPKFVASRFAKMATSIVEDFIPPVQGHKYVNFCQSVLQNTGAKYVAQTFIMEQYLDGPEVDVDLVMSGGEAVYGAITDNWPTVEP